jgi:hypothetical protein
MWPLWVMVSAIVVVISKSISFGIIFLVLYFIIIVVNSASNISISVIS